MSETTLRVGPPAEATVGRLSALDLLRVARPGLMVSHVWVFLLPASVGEFRPGWELWVGLAYVTLPLGLLIYGWNDYYDSDVDAISRRKNRPVTAAVFGTRLTGRRHAALPRVIAVAQVPFALLWAATGRVELLLWMAAMAAGNALYNGPGLRLSRVPVLAELTATAIYLLIAWLGVLLHTAGLPLWLWLFAGLSILNLQILGTLVDLDDDIRVGKRTLSVAFGPTVSLVSVLAVLGLKAALTWRYTGDAWATAVMVAGVALVAARLSLPAWRPSSTAYSASILLDWAWLAIVYPLG